MAKLKPEITEKFSKKSKKLLKTKRILKPMYKLNGGPSFTFTVACKRRQFPPPAAADRPKHSENFHWKFARSGKKFGDTFLWQEAFRYAIKNIFFTATFHWNSINSNWILAASTPVVSSSQSSAPPPSSVNDGPLPTNISEHAQQSSGTCKISTTSLVHTCTCVFCCKSVMLKKDHLTRKTTK